jgi:hypothetical protein
MFHIIQGILAFEYKHTYRVLSTFPWMDLSRR